MFRKPKRKKAAGLRNKRKTTEDDNDDDDQEASRELRETLKRAKQEHGGGGIKAATDDGDGDDKKKSLMQSFTDSGTTAFSQKDMATATVQHHPKSMEAISKSVVDPKRNKWLAGPIRAPTNIRTTCRFDYQPDICKDYKDTGFCGFGDTCIYLHDRGDTMSGWQLEQAWEVKQKTKKKKQEEEMERFMTNNNGDGDDPSKSTSIAGRGEEGLTSADDGLPFACFLSRIAFEDPVVTTCGHYFSQGPLQEHFRKQKDGTLDGGEGGNGSGSNVYSCPICNRDTHGVMNQPTKLLAKKRKLLGRKATWQEFMDSRGGAGGSQEAE